MLVIIQIKQTFVLGFALKTTLILSKKLFVNGSKLRVSLTKPESPYTLPEWKQYRPYIIYYGDIFKTYLLNSI